MSTVYLNFNGQAMATSAAAQAWLETTGIGQTLTASSAATQLTDELGGGTMIGGTGSDTFDIMDSSETISVAATNVVDTVYAWASYALPTNVNNLTLEVADATGRANSGSDLLIAAAADDTLVAGAGSDVMVDNGAGDTFFQIGPNATKDVIYGFQAGGSSQDVIDLVGTSITNFTQLQSHLTQVGADTLLTLSATQEVLIRNTQVSSLTASDFGFSVNLSAVAPSFDGEFNTLSLYNAATGTGTWKTSFISGNQTGADSWMSHTLASNNEQEIYVDPSYAGSGTTALGLNPFSINNGVLTITASDTPTQDLSALDNYKYISGLLTTEKSFSQLYGYFEIKAELPSGQGVWPAFWLLPANGGWPPELDVMEQVGGSNVYQTSHFTTANGTATDTGFAFNVPTNSTGFHTYGVLWTPTTLAWYVDGVEVATTPTPSDMNTPMYMLVNLAVGGSWPGSAPSNFTSAQMEVDYVKAYTLASLGLSGSTAPASILTSASGASTSASTSSTPTAPTTVAESFAAHAGQALSVSAAQGVLAGDTDHNGETLSAVLAANGGPTHGTLVLNANGSFTYTPNAGFAGTDSFTYIAKDSVSSSAPTTVTLTVAASAPTAAAESYATHAGQSLTVSAAQGVLAGETDPNGLSLKATLAANGGPSHGTLTLNADGSFTYTPTLGFAGTDSFTYIASDGLAAATPTKVTLSVADPPPTAKADTYAAVSGQALVESAAKGVLANDVDNNGLTLTAALAQNGAPSHGTLTLNADGSFTYTPTAGYVGTDSFTYIASDSLSSSTPTTVTLTISAPPATSVAAPVVTGGTGNNVYHVSNSAEQIIVAAGTPNESVIATVSYALPANIQNLTIDGSGLTGTANAGTVSLTSLGGPNTLIGGAGQDTFYVNNVGDKVSAPVGHLGDLIISTVSYDVPSTVRCIELVGTGLTATGNAAGGNYISSLNGDNTLIGGAGGNDVFIVSHANDVIKVAAGTPDETVKAYSSFTLPANVQNLVGEGTAAITLVGNGMNNVITANSGADILTGGGGFDIFVVAPGDKLETITDFSASDRIDISAFEARGETPTFHDYGSYSTVSFSSGEIIKLLGVHASSLEVSGHYVI